MKKNRIASLAVIAMMIAVTLACEASFSTANIKGAGLYSDKDGTQATTEFSQGQVFYSIVELANAPDDTKVKAVWTAVEVQGGKPDTYLYENETTSNGASSVYFELSSETPWPTGKYKVDLYLNDKLDRTLEFNVVGPQIEGARLYADAGASQPTTVFSQDQTFYCIVTLVNAPDDTKVKAVWTAVEAQGEEPNLTITETETTVAESSDIITFNLSNNMLWPTGKFKIDLYLNDALDRTLEFTVE